VPLLLSWSILDQGETHWTFPLYDPIPPFDLPQSFQHTLNPHLLSIIPSREYTILIDSRGSCFFLICLLTMG
jgi:hypothetical protein